MKTSIIFFEDDDEDFDDMNDDDAMRANAQHIRQVQHNLSQVVQELIKRGIEHDLSKWSPIEWPYFSRATSKLKKLTYGSPEYKENLKSLKPAIEAHHQTNRHHPEYFGGDITRMSLIDLIEMLADWKAATERHSDGDIMRSLDINIEKFNIPDSLASVLRNTLEDLKWGHSNL